MLVSILFSMCNIKEMLFYSHLRWDAGFLKCMALDTASASFCTFSFSLIHNMNIEILVENGCRLAWNICVTSIVIVFKT